MPPLLYRIARPLLGRFWVLVRGLTLGVRGIVLDEENRILLIRHGYTPGWTFPGGGVEIGETAEQALARELSEEANVVITGPVELHGIFHQPRFSRRDHVLVYVVRHYRWLGAPKPNREIAECAFFARNALPEGMSPGAKRRLAEIFGNVPVSGDW